MTSEIFSDAEKKCMSRMTHDLIFQLRHCGRADQRLVDQRVFLQRNNEPNESEEIRKRYVACATQFGYSEGYCLTFHDLENETNP